MNQAKPSDQQEVHVSVSEPQTYVSINNRIETALAQGRIQSDRGIAQKREQFMSEQQIQVDNRLNSIVNHLSKIGGELLYECQKSFCITARVTTLEVKKLAKLPTVTRIDKVVPLEANSLKGEEVVNGSQIQQFIDEGYEADGYNAGVIEVQRINHDHPGFSDGNSSSRLQELHHCDGGQCQSINTFPNPKGHPTAVSGLVAGDLTENQDPSVASNAQVDKSGYARDADLFFWHSPDLSSDFGIAVDDDLNHELRTLNISIAETTNPECKGKGSLSKTANKLYENGIFATFAAGNRGYGLPSSTDSTVEPPGSAIGLFTVGGHTTGQGNNEDDVRYGKIYPDSSRGGTSSEGKRTIIDITAPACRREMLDKGDTYSYSACGTSYAAPTVSAGALNFIEFYDTNYGTGAIHPGAVTANMLLMGDRKREHGKKRDTGFSNLWGAGRLKMRMWNNSGMDVPWEWGSYSTCVDDSQTVYHQMDDSFLSSDVDAFKAVVWWYDERHEEGKSIDDIDLALEEQKSQGWTSTVSSRDSYDEKERVFYSDFSRGNSFRIAIEGIDVTSDNPTCGTDSIKVHYAFFYEDSSRDNDGPDCDEIDPEAEICDFCPNAKPSCP
jgi:hypothetical protein